MEVVNMRDNIETNEQSYMKKQEAILQETIHKDHSISQPSITAATSTPPSASASPTHEFSFTISLHPHPPQKSTQNGHKYTFNNTNNDNYNSTTTTPPSEPLTAIDLSPADDIFFHGHLLPLHLLSHLPISPRSSTTSVDSFTLPMKDILKDQHNPIGNTSFHYHQRNTFSDFNLPNKNAMNQTRPKSKSFSIFNRPKAKKGSLDDKQSDHHANQEQEKERNNNSKKKLKLEVAQLIKRYMKMVRPLLSFQKAKKSNNNEFNRQPHSFSGNLVSSRRSSFPVEMRTAPASMRTSPANSGVLLASGTISPAMSTTSDSTMEELHAAIQAAIAHCKSSISMEDKIVQA
ncbi:BRI1 kinase inhibitor 1 [Artemisia annua]|uniref:BRI1 kinase inhibitor 1 n=1 Tax=Artemisia annua TaxID=35608 RepID=A0A2U1P7M6_ARTAN|nr:BRI1 kinase inhibitor 1 [Artemisia annua]